MLAPCGLPASCAAGGSLAGTAAYLGEVFEGHFIKHTGACHSRLHLVCGLALPPARSRGSSQADALLHAAGRGRRTTHCDAEWSGACGLTSEIELAARLNASAAPLKAGAYQEHQHLAGLHCQLAIPAARACRQGARVGCERQDCATARLCKVLPHTRNGSACSPVVRRRRHCRKRAGGYAAASHRHCRHCNGNVARRCPTGGVGGAAAAEGIGAQVAPFLWPALQQCWNSSVYCTCCQLRVQVPYPLPGPGLPAPTFSGCISASTEAAVRQTAPDSNARALSASIRMACTTVQAGSTRQSNR